MLIDMTLAAASGTVAPGDFHVRVDGSRVTLPASFVETLQQHGIRSLPDLLSYAHSFPSAVAAILERPVEDVLRATSRLDAELAKELPPELKRSNARPEPSYGALGPVGQGQA